MLRPDLIASHSSALVGCRTSFVVWQCFDDFRAPGALLVTQESNCISVPEPLTETGAGSASHSELLARDAIIRAWGSSIFRRYRAKC